MSNTIAIGGIRVNKKQKTAKITKRSKSDIALAYVLCFPALFFLILFKVFPLFFATYISLHKWGIKKEAFIGLDNYIKIFSNDFFYNDPVLGFQLGEFSKSMLVTLNYAIFSIPAALIISFLIAYMLFYKFGKKLTGALRTIFFLPYITSQVSAILIFKWIFHPQVGLANSIMSFLGLQPQKWLTDPQPVLIKLLSLFNIAWPSNIPAQFAGPTLALSIIILYTIWIGEGLPTLISEELTGNVNNYQLFFDVLQKVSPVPISFENIPNWAKGYYHIEERRIAIHHNMIEVQTVKTAIHEICHAKLHVFDLKKARTEIDTELKELPKDRHTKEVEAESIAYTVCQHYAIETSDYSFGYVASWSSSKELAELKSSLAIIRDTAAELITAINENYATLLNDCGIFLSTVG